jgi:hypothetical protein
LYIGAAVASSVVSGATMPGKLIVCTTSTEQSSLENVLSWHIQKLL